jgi:hypothetical protein
MCGGRRGVLIGRLRGHGRWQHCGVDDGGDARACGRRWHNAGVRAAAVQCRHAGGGGRAWCFKGAVGVRGVAWATAMAWAMMAVIRFRPRALRVN